MLSEHQNHMAAQGGDNTAEWEKLFNANAKLRINWKHLFVVYFNGHGPGYGCMGTCSDGNRERSCNTLLEFIDVPSLDVPALDMQQTMQLVDDIKAESSRYKQFIFAGLKLADIESSFSILNNIHKHPCKKLLDWACPVACPRKDSGNLPNQKGYVKEFEPLAPFEAQFYERFTERYNISFHDNERFQVDTSFSWSKSLGDVWEVFLHFLNAMGSYNWKWLYDPVVVVHNDSEF